MTSKLLQPDYAKVTDKEGRYIASLSEVELRDLKQRAETWYASHPDAHNAKVDVLYHAVIHYLDKLTTVSLQDAFNRFGELRRAAIKLGYVAPPISGTPPKAQIAEVNKLLEQCIQCAEPLPGEDESLTRKITAACQAELNTTIAAINAAIDNPYPVKR